MDKIKKQRDLKRWIAVGVAVFLFIMSLSSSILSNKFIENRGKNFVTDFIHNDYTESVESGSNPLERIIVIPVHGVISDQIGGEYDHKLIIDSIKQVKNDPTIKGILVDIDSPGGAAYQSAEVFNRLYDIRENTDIPIYVTMGAYAASGGYYIASAADQIYAANETVTGSIGVIGSYMNFKGLYDKLGVKNERFATGEYKAIPPTGQDLTENQRKFIEQDIDKMYNQFIDAIVKGRHAKKENILKLADGRTFFGNEAIENGLVDHIGYYEDALAALIKKTATKDPEVFRLELSPLNFNGRFPFPFNLFTKSSLDTSSLVDQVVNRLTQESISYPVFMYGGE